LIIINKEQKNVKNPDIFNKLKWLKSNLVVSYEYNNENFVKESQRRSILDEATEPKMNIQNALNRQGFDPAQQQPTPKAGLNRDRPNKKNDKELFQV
jgi:hypothetical protein